MMQVVQVLWYRPQITWNIMNAILYYESSYVLVVGPQSFLRLDLPFEGSCQPYHQQLKHKTVFNTCPQ